MPTLSFQENNDFNLFNLLFELDDVINIFSKRFWSDLSYGSVNWGLLPFYTDLKSLVNSYGDIKDGIINSDLSNNRDRSFAKRHAYSTSGYYNTNTFYSYEGSVIVNGRFSMQLPDLSSSELSLRIFADELGVHPDISTLWDILPFSFILDYYLPIGQLIDSIHPQGWFVPKWNFTGTVTLMGDLSYSYGVNPSLGRGPLATDKVYVRKISQTINNLVYTPPQLSLWKSPSLRQVFNTAYVALAGRRLSKASRLSR